MEATDATAAGDGAGAVDALPHPTDVVPSAAPADDAPSCSHALSASSSTPPSAPPPPGYVLVTLRLHGQTQPAVHKLPIEVLPCHTFADVCEAALARLPHVPAGFGLQSAFLVMGALEAPLADPHTAARATLRSFPPAAELAFDVGPLHPQGAAARIARVAPRRQRRWPRQLARVAIGVAKVVLAVEAAALLSGSVGAAVWRVRRAAGWGGADSDSASGGGGGRDAGGGGVEDTEAAMEAVADYVVGRGDISALARFDPRVVVGALEEINTEVLEQLDVPDVADTREAVRTLVAQLRQDQQEAAEAAAGAGGSAGAAGPAAAAAETQASTSAARPSGSVPGGRPSGQQGTGSPGGAAVGSAGEGADKGEAGAEAPLPGFGPSASASSVRGRGGRDGAKGASR